MKSSLVGGEEGGNFLNRAGKGWSWLGHAGGRTQTNEPTNEQKLTPHPSPLHLLLFFSVGRLPQLSDEITIKLSYEEERTVRFQFNENVQLLFCP